MNTQITISDRDSAGCKTGLAGLFGNISLVLLKLAVGYLSNSIAIIADALNNLTDCASSLVTIASFFMASKDKDQMHPYGHGRMEYICGFMISNLILITAVTALKDSVSRLIHPQEVHVSGAVILTLAAAVLIKLAMASHVNSQNKSVCSPALTAVRNDDLSDSLVTGVTLAGILMVPFTSVPIDGILGILVALSILWSGFTSFRDNLTLLLGEGSDLETEQQIRQIISEYTLFKDIESINIHDYGPEEKPAYIKVSFQRSPGSPGASTTLELVKKRLKDELQLDAVLYWDAGKKTV